MSDEDATSCRIQRDEDRPVVLPMRTWSRQDARGDLRRQSERLTPGGAFATASVTRGATLTCSDDVRLTQGPTTWMFAPAEGGVWVLVPALSAVLVGRGRRPSRGNRFDNWPTIRS